MLPKLFQWRPGYVGILLFQLLLLTDLTTVGLAKKGGGGGVGRGAKTGTGSVSRNTGGSNTANRGSPTYNKPSSGGAAVGAGSSYGNKKPSSGGGSWKTHAAAGVAGAVIGAAVSHQLTKSYYKYGYGGRDYYYGDRYYRPSNSYSKTCRYSLSETDYMKYEDDAYTVKEIVFECNGRSEYCCEMECCSNMPWWSIMLVVIAAICLVACCVFAVMKLRRGRQNTRFSNTGTSEASVPLQASNTDYANGAKAHAAAGGYYAGAPSYPPYPAGPGAGGWQEQPPPYPQSYAGYPPPAPTYGFNVQPSGPYPKQY